MDLLHVIGFKWHFTNDGACSSPDSIPIAAKDKRNLIGVNNEWERGKSKHGVNLQIDITEDYLYTPRDIVRGLLIKLNLVVPSSLTRN